MINKRCEVKSGAKERARPLVINGPSFEDNSSTTKRVSDFALGRSVGALAARC